jgi:hypothetical protein
MQAVIATGAIAVVGQKKETELSPVTEGILISDYFFLNGISDSSVRWYLF